MITNDFGAQVKLASGVNALLGLILIASPWLCGDAWQYHGITFNNIVTGAVIAICGAVRMYWPHRAVGLSVVNIGCGLWTLIALAAFGYDVHPWHLWLNIIVSVALMVFGLCSVSAKLNESRSP
jgi:peptidoglycan/LPS O-acetylase OafA/YrhL